MLAFQWSRCATLAFLRHDARSCQQVCSARFAQPKGSIPHTVVPPSPRQLALHDSVGCWLPRSRPRCLHPPLTVCCTGRSGRRHPRTAVAAWHRVHLEAVVITHRNLDVLDPPVRSRG